MASAPSSPDEPQMATQNSSGRVEPAAEMADPEALEQAGRLVEAEQAYRALLATHPGHPGVMHNLGLLLLKRGASEDAAAMIHAAIDIEPDKAVFWNSLGVALRSLGRAEEAEAAYSKAIVLWPAYHEAFYNLGVLREMSGRLQESLTAYGEAVGLNPQYAMALTRIAAILFGTGRPAEAIPFLEKATAAAPSLFDAHYYQGCVLSVLKRHAEAVSALRRACELKPDSFEAAMAIANALRDAGRLDESLDAHWRLLEMRPDRSSTHVDLNRLAWMAGRTDLFLRSFELARQRQGDDPELMALESGFQFRRKEFATAEELQRRAIALAPGRADLHGLLARSLASQGKFAESYDYFIHAIAHEPNVMLHRHELAFALLQDNRAADALEVLKRAAGIQPDDQLTLAAMTTSLRVLRDPRYAELAAFNFIKVYDLGDTGGGVSALSFNQQLAAELDRLHTSKVEPIDQTLRGGTQTNGQLFEEKSPAIVQLRARIERAVADYIRELPDDPAHPMSRRKSPSFQFSGSWSCRLATQGFHDNHVHPQGWISSAYYVRLPAAPTSAEARDGWLKFGESNLQLGEIDRPQFLVRPAVGRLVLFPSYFWHGTLPFADHGDRLSVAFDVVPVPDSVENSTA